MSGGTVTEIFMLMPIGSHNAWAGYWQLWMQSAPPEEREFKNYGEAESAGRRHVKEHGLAAFRIEKIYRQTNPEDGPLTLPPPGMFPGSDSSSSDVGRSHVSHAPEDGPTVRHPSGLIVPGLMVPEHVAAERAASSRS